MSASAMRLKAAAGPEFMVCDVLIGSDCPARPARNLIVRRRRGFADLP